jgi:putative DNA primase/helicase
MPAITMQQRFATIIAGMETEPEPDNFRLITPDLQSIPMPSLSGSVGQDLVEEHLDGVELVILDNLSTLTTGRENEAESWLPVQQWALSLRRRGISVLLDHHAGRNGEQRGTSKREDVLDTMLTLRHPADYLTSEGARFEVHFTKARNIHGPDAEPFEVRMETREGTAVWRILSLEDVTQAKARDLFESGMSVRDIAEELKISKSKVQRIKDRFKLLKGGLDEQ